jgi:DNA-binding response OmpR family regulator
MSKQLLIIHPNASVQHNLKKAFGDYTVVVQTDHVSAIHWLDEGNSADFILTGLQLNHVSTVEFISAIRLSNAFREIPVLVLAAETDSLYARIECLETGADDCIPIEIHALELRAKVRSILRRKGQPDTQPSAERTFAFEAASVDMLMA